MPRLLAWFAQNARDLPWRRTLDPYAIWVSEVMLQQTQVKTVVPYWERWLRALPTVAALARARPTKVLKLWEGLGYYTRARNLHAAAKVVVARYGGRFPEDFDEVLSLPGVGRYTAGAICSIAFNQPTPVLDGNVARVLTRVFGIEAEPRASTTRALLWQLAERLVQRAAAVEAGPARNCSSLNQALMELGAVICTPRNPRCRDCPVLRLCRACKEDRVNDLPTSRRRVPATSRRFIAFVAERHGSFLVRQRPAGGVNAHLWEFPNLDVTAGQPRVGLLARELFGAAPCRLRGLGQIEHTITRYRITMEVHQVRFDGAAPKPSPGERWLTVRQLDRLAFPSAHRKALRLVASLRRENAAPRSRARGRAVPSASSE